MAKVKLIKLIEKREQDIKVIDILDQKLEVLPYISTIDKYDLISMALQESLVSGRVNSVKLDAVFNVFLTLFYTNIQLTSSQREDLLGTYDILNNNGLIDIIVEAIPEKEYDDLIEKLELEIASKDRYASSLAGVIENLVSFLPSVIGNLNDTLGNIDEEMVANLLEIARENGGAN